MNAAPITAARTATRIAIASLVATLAVATVACGSDDDGGAARADTAVTTVEPAAATTTAHGHDDEPVATDSTGDTPTDTTADTMPAVTGPAAGVIEIEAVDYAFEHLPGSVPAGTRLALTNTANAELHELVAIRLPDDETRPVEELMRLPEAELGGILGAAPPAAVLLAAPGGEQIAAVGDGTLTEPGRYLVFCSIPSGVSPNVYLEAAAAAGGQQPQVDGGPPHFVHGMFGELVVE